MNKIQVIKLILEKKFCKSRRPSPIETTALLFQSAQKALDCASEDGRLWTRESVREFGRSRGTLTAWRILAAGKQLTLYNFFAYSDQTLEGYRYKIILEKDGLTLLVYECPFRNAIEADADCYCTYIDRAIVDGYNDQVKIENSIAERSGNKIVSLIELEHQPMHVSGSGVCRLRYTGAR